MPASAAPDLHQVLRQSPGGGLSCRILAGTLISTDRVAERTLERNHRWYSGEAPFGGDRSDRLCHDNGRCVWSTASFTTSWSP